MAANAAGPLLMKELQNARQAFSVGALVTGFTNNKAVITATRKTALGPFWIFMWCISLAIPAGIGLGYYLSAPAATGGERTVIGELQRIGFERSGGPLHLTVSGSVNFQGNVAEVTSLRGNYRRQLAPEEVHLFQRLDMSALRAIASQKTGPGSPDRYQYDVEIEVTGEAPIRLRFYEGGSESLGNQAAGLADLTSWVRHEIEAIWKQTTEARP